MSIKISTAWSITLTLLGIGIMIIPPEIVPYVGIPILVLGILVGLWTIIGLLYFKRLKFLLPNRIHNKFLKANFDAIGMSSPYVDFYFNIHSCLNSNLILTGETKGDLWNPYIEAWRSSWKIDIKYQNIIKPDTDTEIKIRWIVPQGHHSPMTEFAFRANDKPPEKKEQHLSFEDMYIELKARFLRLEGKIGWLQLAQGDIPVCVPNHIAFDTVRKEYLRQKND